MFQVTNENQVNISVAKKTAYVSPSLKCYGSVVELTLGNGGTSIDGNGLRSQSGGGNNVKV